MAAVAWLGLGAMAWAGVMAGYGWLLPPAAACSLFGALDLWESFAGADEED